MGYKKIKRVFPFIKKGRQKVGFEVENSKYIVYLSASQVKANTNLDINEIEMLEGCLIRPQFYSKGEIMYGGLVCSKDNCVIREFWIETLIHSTDEFRKFRQHKLVKLKKIKRVFTFDRNGTQRSGIETTDENIYFLSSKRLEAITGMDSSEHHILESSFINPVFYEIGEQMLGSVVCHAENTIIKELNLRFSDSIQKMHENFENKEPSYFYSKSVNHIESHDESQYGGYRDGYGGYLDDDFVNDALGGEPDAYWNLD